MNIFLVDHDPQFAAMMLCDKHVLKMILESAQLLSTAHRVLDGEFLYDDAVGMDAKRFFLRPRGYTHTDNLLYKATHINHPCSIWARYNRGTYSWLADHLTYLCEEYGYRYSKIHKCQDTGLVGFLRSHYPMNIDPSHNFKWEDWPQAMPDHYKKDDPVEAYRDYYAGDKAYFAKWKLRPIPQWFNDRLGPDADDISIYFKEDEEDYEYASVE